MAGGDAAVLHVLLNFVVWIYLVPEKDSVGVVAGCRLHNDT